MNATKKKYGYPKLLKTIFFFLSVKGGKGLSNYQIIFKIHIQIHFYFNILKGSKVNMLASITGLLGLVCLPVKKKKKNRYR